MHETSKATITEIMERQKAFYNTQQTQDVKYRIAQLRKLKKACAKYKGKLEEALWKDLHKSPEESYLTELSVVSLELDNHIKHLKKWAKPKWVPTPVHVMPATSKIHYEPLGLSLIISPWNYPFQLTINPLIGAISAGCCAVLKPSPDSPATSLVMQEMIEETFDSSYICVVQGGKETNQILLQEKFDIFFFTGSSRVGKIVMEAASKHLTQVVLELGGKSPCIVDKEAKLDIAAKRIVWGKLINAGQTCIAPDYIYVHASIKDELMDRMAYYIQEMYGPNPKESRFYPRIVTHNAVERLMGYLKQGDIHTGGEVDYDEKYIAPTIIDNVQLDFDIMQDEIFGPLFPILSFQDISEPIDYINTNEKPLAFYYFGKNKKAKKVLQQTSSGGGCINDTLMHIVNHNLPFGGVNYSGISKYHGRESFLAFSNRRAMVSTSTLIDLPLRYVPFKYFDLIKRII